MFTVSEKGKNELYDVKYYSKSEIEKIRKIDHVINIKKDISYTSAYIVYNGKKYDLVSLSSNSNIKDKNIKLGNVPKTNEIVISEYLSDNILNKRQNDLVGKNIKLYLLDSSKTSPTLLTKNLFCGWNFVCYFAMSKGQRPNRQIKMRFLNAMTKKY